MDRVHDHHARHRVIFILQRLQDLIRIQLLKPREASRLLGVECAVLHLHQVRVPDPGIGKEIMTVLMGKQPLNA